MIIKKSYKNVVQASVDVAGKRYSFEGRQAVLLLLLVDRPDGISRLELLDAAPLAVALCADNYVHRLRRRGIHIRAIKSPEGPERLRFQLAAPVFITGGALIWDAGVIHLERLAERSSRPNSDPASYSDPTEILPF